MVTLKEIVFVGDNGQHTLRQLFTLIFLIIMEQINKSKRAKYDLPDHYYSPIVLNYPPKTFCIIIKYLGILTEAL